MQINGFTAILTLLALAGVCVYGTLLLRAWVYRSALTNLERCFSEASHQTQQSNIPTVALCTMMTLRTPALRDTLVRTHWMATLSTVAWGALVLDTVAPDLQLSDPALRRWYRGILADAQRVVPKSVRISARQFAADPVGGTGTHPDAWLPGGAVQAPHDVVLDPADGVTLSAWDGRERVVPILPATDAEWLEACDDVVIELCDEAEVGS